MPPLLATELRLRIVVVEDDSLQCDLLQQGLAHFGHEVRSASSGCELDTLLQQAPADIIILDLGLPGEDGIDIAARLRPHWRGGLVMITARGQTEDRILGRDMGADLYFVKPIDLRELASALQNLAVRLPPAGPTSWRLDESASQLITPQGISISLTAQECILLRLLLEKQGENVPRQVFFTSFAYPDTPSADSRLEGLVSRLRTKVRRADPRSPLPIQSRYNMGYIFLTNAGD